MSKALAAVIAAVVFIIATVVIFMASVLWVFVFTHFPYVEDATAKAMFELGGYLGGFFLSMLSPLLGAYTADRTFLWLIGRAP
ncbi:hypothetical protein [Oceanithermus sp.]|uniref:hypothetical protein n=1 Tax=Oceanithermus sp. TaxID=2268145 RepID=UPI00257D59E8|nr:hypothetical protein [Oceanithermus sp.]